MENPIHSLPSLFKQLGLPSDQAAIDAFVAEHGPLPPTCPLSKAPFWNSAQAAFLREEILEDADWAEVVDQLSLMLRG
jgi:hypothetical protein